MSDKVYTICKVMNTQRTKMPKNFSTIETLAIAIAVDRQQGFIKSGHGYYNHDAEQYVSDNKTVVMSVLLEQEHNVDVIDADQTQARELLNYFSDVIVEKKILGEANGFEDTVGKILSNDTVDSYGVAILASLPNSLRVQKKRDLLDDFYTEHRPKSEYIGKIKDRIGLNIEIVDVKYISKYNIHLVTSVTKDENIVRFFWNKDPDIADIIEGKTVSIVGTIREQEVSKFSHCKETVLNRVKISPKK